MFIVLYFHSFTTVFAGFARFGLGFCYSIVYCPLFVKLTDCWRSLDKPDPYIVKYDKLASPTGLFMVTCFLIMVQVGGFLAQHGILYLFVRFACNGILVLFCSNNNDDRRRTTF